MAKETEVSATYIPASIEVSPRQAAESEDLPGLFPAGTRVYITDIGVDTTETLVKAAKRVTDLGYVAVPHFASRRLTTLAALEERMKATTQEAGVKDILIIGGGRDKPVGTFSSSMDVIRTGFIEKFGITDVAVAGHPEGSPDFTEAAAFAALKLKQAYAAESGVRVRIVTQFGFDADRFVDWSEGLSAHGIDLPVHLGVAGPAKITTLVKFAVECGVGNSLDFLKKRAMSLATLASGFSPETITDPIEQHYLQTPNSAIKQIHVFPFGGLKKSTEWLYERRSWQKS